MGLLALLVIYVFQFEICTIFLLEVGRFILIRNAEEFFFEVNKLLVISKLTVTFYYPAEFPLFVSRSRTPSIISKLIRSITTDARSIIK